MARKKAPAAKPSKASEEVDDDGFPLPETEEESTPSTEETPAVAKAAAKDMSKADAVRAALAAGYDKPKEGVAYIKEKFGMEVTTGTFSVTKSQDAKKAGGEGEGDGKKTPTPPAPTGHDSMGGSPAALLRQVKELADRHGGDEIREILAILGK